MGQAEVKETSPQTESVSAEKSEKGTPQKKEEKKKQTEQKKAGSKSKEKKDSKKDKKKTGVKFSIRYKFSLAIIAMVTVIIGSIAAYFIYRETNLLREQAFTFITRELKHLSNTARQSIGFDELALFSAIDELKKLSYTHKKKKIFYITYAFVLNSNDKIILFFDRRGKQAVGEKIKDPLQRELSKRANDKITKVVKSKDPKDTQGTIYDFSRTIFNVKKQKFGTVIIGLSDIVIRLERDNLLKTVAQIFFGFLLLSILGSVILASIIIKPIRILSHGASVIGKGDLDHRIDIKSTDELGRLAREFNDMTAMIKEAKNQEIESRLMEEQLEMAKDIQEGLNPMGYYDKGGVQIKGFTRAAKGVGGDYFDYIDIDENRVGALISDVSGKGVPASLVMVMIRTVFTSYISRKDVDCARVVRAINDSLSADFAIDKFATLFFLIYDRSTQEVVFANAGHGPLFTYRKHLNKCTAAKLDGVPIGIMEDAEYQQAKLKLNPGDIVVMYTDGITEMRNPEKDEYGLSRVQHFMIDNNDLSAKDFVEKLVDDVDTFRGEAKPHDDMTVLVFKRDS